MTNKEVIIDGVNVAGCGFAEESATTPKCRINGYVHCDGCNCYYKQLQRKEQQVEISQNYNDELTKYILEIGELFKLTQLPTTLGKNCIEYYAILSSAIKNHIKDLQAENEELKAFKEKVMKPVILPMGDESEIINLADRYKQALEEIKEILKHYSETTLGELQKDGTFRYLLNANPMNGHFISNDNSSIETQYLTYDPRPAKEALTIINEVLKDGI